MVLDKCLNCRWSAKKKINFYPCRDCVHWRADSEYDFFTWPEHLNMFGFAELARCRSCGRKVHMSYGENGYKYVICHCGNHLQAKVSVEEMIRRWNNKPPSKTKMWRINKDGLCK